ncbi:hypothetical protein AVEN_170903-1 [Araneus ventricosus]|uniref:Uncharacterized protein n=1 Tax=Araneus ventricosus TaxID=182803 RepID=A0A4Y2UMP0_ARAVE|nr:hypothetical protein AVEN_170903-1 [Araneus ventricosus]
MGQSRIGRVIGSRTECGSSSRTVPGPWRSTFPAVSLQAEKASSGSISSGPILFKPLIIPIDSSSLKSWLRVPLHREMDYSFMWYHLLHRKFPEDNLRANILLDHVLGSDASHLRVMYQLGIST